MNQPIPLVSICCAAYNQENFIKEAIEGFLLQKATFEYEIIINDDASTDQTANIIREYEKKHPNLITGIYQSVNQYSQSIKITKSILFPKASAKYIALCEGDDYWTDPLKLQKQVDFMEANPDFALCSHVSDVLDHGYWIKGEIPEKTELTTTDIITQSWGIMTASMLFRKEALNLPHWYSQIKNGDYGLQLLVSLNGKIKILTDSMSVYRKHPGGISNTLQPFSQATWVIFLLYHFDEYTKHRYKQAIKAKIKSIYKAQISFANDYNLRRAKIKLYFFKILSIFAPFLIKNFRK